MKDIEDGQTYHYCEKCNSVMTGPSPICFDCLHKEREEEKLDNKE